MELTPEEIKNYLIYQVGALKAFAEIHGVKLHHVKPHGAFFRSTKANESQARAMVEAFMEIDPKLMFYCPGPTELYHPTLAKVVAEMGMRLIPEFYADLHYKPDGTMVSPGKGKRVELPPSEAAQRVLRFFQEGKVTTIDGTDLGYEALSICVHGDSPRAVEYLKAMRDALNEAGITMKSVEW